MLENSYKNYLKESSKDSSKDGKVVAVTPDDPKFIGGPQDLNVITLDSLLPMAVNAGNEQLIAQINDMLYEINSRTVGGSEDE